MYIKDFKSRIQKKVLNLNFEFDNITKAKRWKRTTMTFYPNNNKMTINFSLLITLSLVGCHLSLDSKVFALNH